MPWKNNSSVEQRWGFVRLAMRCKTRLAELCRQSGISRKTAYKWIQRFKERGRRGLRDQTRSAHQVHNRPKNKWLQRLGCCKRRHPSWGAPKIHWVLKERYGSKQLPSESAISRWLKQWGLTRKQKRRTRKGPSVARPALRQAQFPNEVWTVDFKGWFRTCDGTRVEPLTVRDLASRYLLAFCLLTEQTVEATQLEFQKIFRTYGLPLVIRVDNGSPFGSTGALGLTRLSAWWVRLGIEVQFIEPGHPEQNGGHEQMHRIYKAETLPVTAQTLRSHQRVTQKWCWEYNHLRPHEGLAMRVPARCYRKSRRPQPARLKAWKYPPDWESRLVKGKGMISLHGRGRYVGEAFERQRVGLQRVLPGKWKVYFGSHLMGELYDTDAGGIRAVRYEKKRRR